uniref:Uncharacterized protein n=1 Tax=Apteryx owenii TaxID=8824 RepID=A0A8B9SFX7_APTOW
MQWSKGEGNQDWCHGGSACADPVGAGGLSPCHDPGSLSRDIEGSCQSEPQGCPPGEPARPLEPWPIRSCCPAPQSRCPSKPRRRVELPPEQPLCPPVKIHRRPLQQYRPPLHPCEPGSCGKPRRRVEQLPAPPACPPGKRLHRGAPQPPGRRLAPFSLRLPRPHPAPPAGTMAPAWCRLQICPVPSVPSSRALGRVSNSSTRAAASHSPPVAAPPVRVSPRGSAKVPWETALQAQVAPPQSRPPAQFAPSDSVGSSQSPSRASGAWKCFQGPAEMGAPGH